MDKQTKKPAQVWHRKHTGDFAIAAIASYPKCVCGYVFHPLKRFSEQTPPTDIFCITIYHRQRKFIGRIMRYRCVLEDCVWRFWAPSRWEMVVYIVEFKCNKSWACRQTSEDTFTYFCFPLAHFLNHLTTLWFLLFCNSPRDNHFLFGTILVRWWVHRTEKQNKQKNQTVQHVGKMKHMRKKNLTFSHVPEVERLCGGVRVTHSQTLHGADLIWILNKKTWDTHTLMIWHPLFHFDWWKES